MKRNYKFPSGTRIRTTEGCGMANREGVVIQWSEVPFRMDGSGVPDLWGYYNVPDRKHEVPCKDAYGNVFIMFPNYLEKVR